MTTAMPHPNTDVILKKQLTTACGGEKVLGAGKDRMEGKPHTSTHCISSEEQ